MNSEITLVLSPFFPGALAASIPKEQFYYRIYRFKYNGDELRNPKPNISFQVQIYTRHDCWGMVLVD